MLRPGGGTIRSQDRARIYLAKGFRAVAYGALSAFLFLYLNEVLGFPVFSSLALTGVSLVGSALWSLFALPPIEAAWGRRRSTLLFAGLFALSGVLLYLAAAPALVVLAVLLGGVAASTADNGPLSSLEQAILPTTVRTPERSHVFAWYNLLAYVAAAVGALLLVIPGALDPRSIPYLPPAPHPWILLVYAVLAFATWAAYWGLSPAIDVEPIPRARSEAPLSPTTRRYVRDLSALFSVDAFAGGLIINPVIAAYFVLVWNQSASGVGFILFLLGTVTALSFLAAPWISARFGLLPTMVFTHLPSNVLLFLVPLMPSFPLALGVLSARSALSQLDVPTRQTYVMTLVANRERARVAGTLGGVRGIAQSVGPFPAAALQAVGYVASPFFLAGGLKLIYDLALWSRFRRVRLPEEPEPVESPVEPVATSASSTRPS